MGTNNPPTYYFTSIGFNPAFYQFETTGLTTAQANALYLRKTVQDTATAQETFQSGIKTASIDSTLSSTNMTIGGNLAPTTTLTLGSTGTITTNNGTLQSQTLSSINTGTTMNIGANHGNVIAIGQAGISTTNLYGTVQAGTIDAFTTTGTLNLGQNLSAGTLNVATGTNVDVNVGTGTRSTATVHNYSDGDNCVAGSNVHFNNGTSNLSNTNIHNGASSAGLVQIGTGASSTTAVSIATRGASSTNAVRIGNVSNTTYLDSDTIAMGVLGLTGSGNISLATGTNTAGAQVSIGSTSLTAVNIRGGQTNLETTTLNLNTTGVGNTLIGTVGGSNSITINRPLSTNFAYNYNVSTIGGRYDSGGIGGALVTVTGDGLWRNYLYVNGLSQGIYMFSYWANPGGGVYSNVAQQIYQRATAFTGVGVTISTPSTYQYYVNCVPNLSGAVGGQIAIPFVVAIDSATPNVAFAMQCNTAPVSFATYHGLSMWRVA
jgi:hypothetical protein